MQPAAQRVVRELTAKGFDVAPGALGENVVTAGIALLALPVGTELRLGASALVRLTGLRNPCVQIDRFQPGLQGVQLSTCSMAVLAISCHLWHAGTE